MRKYIEQFGGEWENEQNPLDPTPAWKVKKPTERFFSLNPELDIERARIAPRVVAQSRRHNQGFNIINGRVQRITRPGTFRELKGFGRAWWN